jgi:FkbH-like protein
VLVPDLDNTLWSGIVGDDGAAGVSARPEGKGYPHFLLQGLVRALQQDGVLIAAVSKNDAETAREPFRTGSMPLREEHFVAILASWHAKSAQIRELASRLNLGLDAFVFIDDNVLELEEVRRELPAVTTRRFPSEVSALPDFLADLQALFRRRTLSTEDRERTALYRRRLDGMVPQEAAGADLTAFLRELEMTLRITDRSTGDRTRAVQLINKTNQFNLNGERLSDAEVGALLARGGRLLTATLEDRTGSHGEILACLLDGDGVIRSFVLSCRVFQRRVEHAFVAWLATQEPAPTAFAFRRTERNGPLRDFLTRQLDDPAAEAMLLPFDAETLLGEQADTQTLIRLDVATADA